MVDEPPEGWGRLAAAELAMRELECSRTGGNVPVRACAGERMNGRERRKRDGNEWHEWRERSVAW